jgi:hypothetical protein
VVVAKAHFATLCISNRLVANYVVVYTAIDCHHRVDDRQVCVVVMVVAVDIAVVDDIDRARLVIDDDTEYGERRRDMVNNWIINCTIFFTLHSSLLRQTLII